MTDLEYIRLLGLKKEFVKPHVELPKPGSQDTRLI